MMTVPWRSVNTSPRSRRTFRCREMVGCGTPSSFVSSVTLRGISFKAYEDEDARGIGEGGTKIRFQLDNFLL